MSYILKFVYKLILIGSFAPLCARAGDALDQLERITGYALPAATRHALTRELAKTPSRPWRQDIADTGAADASESHVLACVGPQVALIVSYQGVVCVDPHNGRSYLMQAAGVRVPFAFALGLTFGVLWIRTPSSMAIEGNYTGIGGTAIVPRIISADGSRLEPKDLFRTSPLDWGAHAISGRNMIYTGVAPGVELSVGAVYISLERL